MTNRARSYNTLATLFQSSSDFYLSLKKVFETEELEFDAVDAASIIELAETQNHLNKRFIEIINNVRARSKKDVQSV